MANKTYVGTTINSSATIRVPAGEAITDVQGIALALNNKGEAVLPTAGADVIGLALFTNDDPAKGDDLDLQIKDIGKWVAGGEIKAGEHLAANASGKCVKATTGAFIFAVALTAAAEAGAVVSVQIVKAGYEE